MSTWEDQRAGLVRARSSQRSLRDLAVREIRRRIFSGQLPPGSRIEQDVLARELGVSRVPIREALIVLHDEGVVESIARRGTYVGRLRRDDVRDHYRLLGVISGIAAERSAGRLGSGQLDAMRALASRMENTSDPREQERLNHEYHRIINLAAGSKRLLAVIAMLAKSVPGQFYESHELWPTTAHADHRRIIEVLEQDDAALARSEVEEHFAKGADQAVARLETRGFWQADTTLPDDCRS